MFLIFMPDNCIPNEISKLVEMGVVAPCNYWQMPFLRHWLPHHKSFLSNELEKCHPASELMKLSKGGLHMCVYVCVCVHAWKRVHHTPVTHFFSLNALCRCQPPCLLATERKRGRGEIVSEDKREMLIQSGIQIPLFLYFMRNFRVVLKGVSYSGYSLMSKLFV